VGEPSGGLETGAIVGIVVGGVCCALISALVLVAIVRSRGKSDVRSDRKSAEFGVPLDRAADDPGAQYGILPVAKPSSHYLEHAGDFKVAESESPHYAVLSATEAGEREPHYAVPKTQPVPAASAEAEPPYDVLSDDEAGRATGTLRSP
jgi:hypothetical protein